MLLGPADHVTGHPPARVRAVAEAHLRAYAHDDLDRLMATVSPRGGVWAGLAPPDGAVIMRTPDEIRRTYQGLLGAVKVGEPGKTLAVCTDWYAFFDGVTEVADKASGTSRRSRSISLFGNDDLGTAVDMAWPFGIIPGVDAAPSPAHAAPDILAAHKRRMAGWAAGDPEAASAGVAERCQLFLPCFAEADPRLAVLVRSREDYIAYLSSLFAAGPPAGFSAANLVVGDRYVFSEHAFTWAPAGKVRLALAEVLNDAGEVHGMLGFAARA